MNEIEFYSGLRQLIGDPKVNEVTNRQLQFSQPRGKGPVKDLAQVFSVQVALENDGDAAALAEAGWGAGRNRSRLIYVTVGTGIGGGNPACELCLLQDLDDVEQSSGGELVQLAVGKEDEVLPEVVSAEAENPDGASFRQRLHPWDEFREHDHASGLSRVAKALLLGKHRHADSEKGG